ncbi:MAG: DNA translocase FtsK, partial [Chloroflexota bacterium]
MATRKPLTPATADGPAPRRSPSSPTSPGKPAARRRVRSTPVPEVIAPEVEGRRGRSRDVARLGILTAAVAVFLLVAKNGPAGSALLNVFGWSAYLLPSVGAAIGLELLRDGQGPRAWPRLEEINGLISLYLAGLIVCGGWGKGGTLGDALAADLGRFFGLAGVPAAAACLLALGLVLSAHLNGRHLWIGSKVVARGSLRAARGTTWGLRSAGRGLGKLRRPRAGARRLLAPAAGDDKSGVEIITAELGASPGLPASGRRKRSKATKPESELPLEAEADAEPEEAEPPAVTVGGVWALPAMDLLESVPATKETTPIDTSLRMRVIEDTLAAFNVRARVTGFHSGPTVT